MSARAVRWHDALSRLIEVASVAALTATRALLWRVWRSFAPARYRPTAGVGELLADACERLGGAFIKVGQAVASRPDLVTEDVRRALARLCDRVTPCPWAQLVKDREHLYELPRRFQTFEPDPIASGCIAQVYRATTREGRVVAVKIRRPGAIRTLSRDVALATAMLRAVRWLPAIRESGIVEAVESTNAALLRQLDFRTEAARWRLCRQNLSRSPRVIVPPVLDEYCDDDVIVSEYIEDLTPAAAASLGPDGNREVARQCLRVLYQMLFIDGLVHGDLHPGNLLCTREGRVVVLDFGICDELAPETRAAFAEFFLGFAFGRGADCARVALQMAGRLPATLDRAAFVRELSAAVGETASTVAEFTVARFAHRMFTIQRRHGIRSTTEFTRGICALLVLEGTLKQLAPALNFKAEAWPFVLSARSRERPRVSA